MHPSDVPEPGFSWSTEDGNPVYITPYQASRRLTLTERALTEMRRRGDGPPYIRLGSASGRVRYDIRELDAWMRSRQVTSTSAESAPGSSHGVGR